MLTFSGHGDAVFDVAFRPECVSPPEASVADPLQGTERCGERIATASVDGTAKVWNAMTGVNLLTLPVKHRGAGGVSFSPDGKRLAVRAVSGVYVFVLPIEDVVTLAKSRLTRTLTTEECQGYLHTSECPAEP